ncbi:aminoacylase-1-like isoform X2 [Contarinia nasturtii]|uniref:aminoacylase-1-like isoform X2 n=1 Tax=Contarinia nasturtii TaxID=265458 RepID=UPI0012D3FB1F|nr:aminoacylase-1-like isoform X2 [Contarinia nasturtii]
MSKWESNEEIQLFREYLRIPSVQPNVDYEPCVSFLKKQAAALNLPISVCFPGNEKCPVIIMSWKGLNSDLPSIMLNSHMDVVPVDENRWTHPPFAADIDENGRIFGRGTQDMKSIGMLYLAAIRALKRDGKQLKRTIHVTFVPDEEIGSEFGMKAFVKSNEFKALNVGFVLDESCAYPLNKVLVFYAERRQLAIELICEGQAGHGAFIQENTPGEKVQYMINKLMGLRKSEADRLKQNPELKPGDVTAINLTILKGGQQINVVPNEMSISFDIRLAIDVNHNDFEEQLQQWCDEAGGGITIKILLNDPEASITKIDHTNPYWVAFESAMKDLNLDFETIVCPGCTDARYLRQLNLPALGFTPLPNTPIKLHDNDEFVDADVYLNGINVYMKVISNLDDVVQTTNTNVVAI